MKGEQSVEALRDLPPDLPSPLDRFEQVAERVSKLREKQAGIPLVAAALVAAVSFICATTFDQEVEQLSSVIDHTSSSIRAWLWAGD